MEEANVEVLGGGGGVYISIRGQGELNEVQ